MFCEAGAFQKQIEDFNIDEKISYWCKFFEGFKYMTSPIDDNKDRMFRLDGFDCVTLVETIIALSYTNTLDQASKKLREIRYRNGVISWENRNHFTSIDWIPENFDILQAIKSNSHRSIWINREAFFDKNNRQIPYNLPKNVYISYPSIDFLDFREIILEKGSYIFNIISRRNWLMVDHVGFLLNHDDTMVFCHASSLLGKVVKQNTNEFEGNRSKKFALSLFRLK